jgi:hypothetical protein
MLCPVPNTCTFARITQSERTPGKVWKGRSTEVVKHIAPTYVEGRELCDRRHVAHGVKMKIFECFYIKQDEKRHEDKDGTVQRTRHKEVK